MKGFTTALITLLAVSTILALAPLALADDTPCVGHTEGAAPRSELVGGGPLSVGTYSASRDAWRTDASTGGDACGAPDCDNTLDGILVPTLGTPAIDTPDVRALGQTVVPRQTIQEQTILGPFTVPLTVPALLPSCLAENTGVYVRVAGVASAGAGTESIPVVSWSMLP